MTVTDEEVIEALEDAFEDGATDGMGGGVPPEEIEKRTALSQSTISKRLRFLANKGDIEQVWGTGGSRNTPRPSYLP